MACLAIAAVVLLSLGNFGRKPDFVLNAVTLTNLKVVGQAMELYCADFDDRFPPGMSSVAQAEPYLAKLLKGGTPLLSLNPGSDQFLGNGTLACRVVSELHEPDHTLMFFDSAPWKSGVRCVIFASQRATKLDETEFQAALKNLFVSPKQ